MPNKIKRIEFPELFFGLVAPIGADIENSVTHLDNTLKSYGYTTITIKVTSVFKRLHEKLPLDKPLLDHPLERRYTTHIGYGNAVRNRFSDDAFLAYTTIAQIIKA